MNETKRTAEVSQIASLIRAKAQKHPEVIDIVVALIDKVSQSSQPEIEALGKQLEQHSGDYPTIMRLLNIQPSPPALNSTQHSAEPYFNVSCAFSLSGNESILPDPESLFPTHLHRYPTQREAKPMQCRHIWRYL